MEQYNDNTAGPSLVPAEGDLAPAGEQEPKPRGRPFEPGQSGNPLGRPKGSRNKATVLAEALLEGEADGIIRTAIEKAKAGEGTAMRLCFERLLPLRRDRPVNFELPELKNAASALEASSAVVAACAAGILTPDEASKVSILIEGYVRTFAVVELEKDVAALKAAAESGKTTKAKD